MKRFKTWFLSGGGLLAGLLLFSLFTKRIVFEDHERFNNNVRQFLNLDHALNEDVLKVRFFLLANYDGFPDQLIKLKRVIAELGTAPAYVAKGPRQVLRRKVDELSQLVAAKEELLERFKSHAAVLNNSLGYFPSISTRLSQLADLDGEWRLTTCVNELTREVLIFTLNPSLNQETSVRQSLAQSVAWGAEHREHPLAPTLSNLIAHVNSILVRKGKVENLTRELVSFSTTDRAEKLLAYYEIQFAQAIRATNQARLILYFVCAALILGIAYFIYALNAANGRLERRVSERTSELVKEVTERKAAAQRLIESLSSLQAINAVLDRACIIARTDDRGAISYVNENFCRASGYSEKELLQQNHRMLKSDEHSDLFFREMWQTIAGGQVWRGEIRNRSKAGADYWIDTTIGRIFGERGQLGVSWQSERTSPSANGRKRMEQS